MGLFHKTPREEYAKLLEKIKDTKLSIEHLEQKERMVGYPHHHVVPTSDPRKMAIMQKINPLKDYLKELEAKKLLALANVKAEDKEKERKQKERRMKESAKAHRILAANLKLELAGK